MSDFNPFKIPELEETALPPLIKEILYEQEPKLQLPKYNVILFNDDNHTYDYVIEMLMTLFGHNSSTAFQMACEVDVLGQVVVCTSNKEHAEHKRDLIINYGPDWRIDNCMFSMSAGVEPTQLDTDIQ